MASAPAPAPAPAPAGVRRNAFVARRPETIELEIRGILRAACISPGICGSRGELEEHISAYTDELIRLRDAYGDAASEVRASIHALGFIYYMIEGLTCGTTRLGEPDPFLKSLIPQSNALDYLTKSKVTRKMFTSGQRYVCDAMERVGTEFQEKHRIRPHALVMRLRHEARERARAVPPAPAPGAGAGAAVGAPPGLLLSVVRTGRKRTAPVVPELRFRETGEPHTSIPPHIPQLWSR